MDRNVLHGTEARHLPPEATITAPRAQPQPPQAVHEPPPHVVTDVLDMMDGPGGPPMTPGIEPAKPRPQATALQRQRHIPAPKTPKFTLTPPAYSPAASAVGVTQCRPPLPPPQSSTILQAVSDPVTMLPAPTATSLRSETLTKDTDTAIDVDTDHASGTIRQLPIPDLQPYIIPAMTPEILT